MQKIFQYAMFEMFHVVRSFEIHNFELSLPHNVFSDIFLHFKWPITCPFQKADTNAEHEVKLFTLFLPG